MQCFIQALARGQSPPGKCDKKIFMGLCPRLHSGERSGDRRAVGEEEKFFFAFVWAGGKNEEKKEKM
jgi:hypothetical protein